MSRTNLCVLLDVGTYKVKVTSNPSDKLEFEKPTFYGDKDKIVIKAGETTQTAIECFLTCVKVTSKFTKPVQDKFASCVAKVSDATGSYLEYDMQVQTDREDGGERPLSSGIRFGG